MDVDRLDEIGRSTYLSVSPAPTTPPTPPPPLRASATSQRVVAMPVSMCTCDHLVGVLNHPLRGLAPVAIAQWGKGEV
ncbi:unnamed protein product [Taenia asiatica]|uniref:Uncharacterized protein n=1 Tax=Taenia asiatica TaxID=60517 RepID=A0A0R3VU83_TAEAS|nr:unnamed protein product [Taenia asiatica]